MQNKVPLFGWVIMSLTGLTGVAAEKSASGSFVTVRAEAQELARIGEEDFRGVSADRRPVSYKIKPKKGWKLKHPRNGKLDLATGELSSYAVASLMGEDNGTGTVHTCDSVMTVVTNHVSPPVLYVSASGTADCILVPPDVTSAQLAIAGNVMVISNGLHAVITTDVPCSICGEPKASVTTNTVDIVPSNYCWAWSVAGTNRNAVGPSLAASACVTNPAYHALSVTAIVTNLPTCCACSAQTVTNCAVYQLESETDATAPANRKRRKLGIGEKVVCRIIPAPVYACWHLNGDGLLSSYEGISTTFLASKTPSNPNTVIVDVGNLSQQISFEVVPPTGMVVTGIRDPIYLDPVVKLGTNQLCAATRFTCYVQPQDVSFYNAKFRENIPLTAYTWPNGRNYQYPSVFRSWEVMDAENLNIDTVDSDFFPVQNLFNGNSFVDFTYSVPVPEEYLNEEGEWISWLSDEQHVREFRGADCKARVKTIMSNEMYGPWMGPWE